MKHEPIVVGYRHTGIITKDINKSLEFYKDILGLELIQDFTDSSDYINEITGLNGATAHFLKLQAKDGTVIELLEYLTHPSELVKLPIINVGVCHIAFRVINADIVYRKLVEKEVKVLSKPVVSSCGIAKVFFCLDPDNIRVEIVEMIN